MKYLKNILAIFIIFIISMCIWGFGASSLFVKIPFIPEFWLNTVSNIDNLENIFSPVAAFFGGLSAVGTIYLIYLQIILTKKQEIDVRRNIFESQLGQMFQMKNELVKILSIDVSGKKYENYYLFELLYGIIFHLMKKYSDSGVVKSGNFTRGGIKDIEILSLFEENIEEEFGMLYTDEIPQTLRVRTLLVAIEDTLNNQFGFILSPFYHNVYTVLKMIESNKDISKNEKMNYMRMFRTQFSQYEFSLIYFHALAHEEKKFKELIEKTCFFHSLAHGFIFIDLTEEVYPEFGYKKSAFEHSESC